MERFCESFREHGMDIKKGRKSQNWICFDTVNENHQFGQYHIKTDNEHHETIQSICFAFYVHENKMT